MGIPQIRGFRVFGAHGLEGLGACRQCSQSARATNAFAAVHARLYASLCRAGPPPQTQALVLSSR